MMITLPQKKRNNPAMALPTLEGKQSSNPSRQKKKSVSITETVLWGVAHIHSPHLHRAPPYQRPFPWLQALEDRLIEMTAH